MEHLIGVAAFLFSAVITWILYAVCANDRATTIMTAELNKINGKLTRFGIYKLSDISTGFGQAPCDVRWSIIPDAKKGLPSRVVYKHLRKWWSKEDPAYLTKLYALCEEVQNKVHKGKFD